MNKQMSKQRIQDLVSQITWFGQALEELGDEMDNTYYEHGADIFLGDDYDWENAYHDIVNRFTRNVSKAFRGEVVEE